MFLTYVESIFHNCGKLFSQLWKNIYMPICSTDSFSSAHVCKQNYVCLLRDEMGSKGQGKQEETLLFLARACVCHK